MPRLFKVGRYLIFFWSNENDEPIHVHVAIKPFENATKIWLTQNGGCVIAHILHTYAKAPGVHASRLGNCSELVSVYGEKRYNKGRIPKKELRELLDIVTTQHFMICNEWKKYFNVDDIKFYC